MGHLADSSPADFPSGRIAIVGAGIVGSALAYYLSSSPEINKPIVLIDRSFSPLNGSTGHAPGFVGQFNESEVLSRLAIDTVREYVKIPGGFDIIGGLEVVSSEQSIRRLKERCEMAKALGLSAQLISPHEAVELAPEILKIEDVDAALHFPGDGAASAGTITQFYQDEARKNGVEFIQADAKAIRTVDGQIVGIDSKTGIIDAGVVVLATGIWTAGLCNLDIPIPIIPVAHPYTYGYPKERTKGEAPWVRWPEHHVYARNHGPYYGFGSYNHRPIYLEPEDTAIGSWISDFDETLTQAKTFLANHQSLDFQTKFNGIFAMTPDNLPLVGPIPSVRGLFMAASVWVTQAAGAARFLTKVMEGQTVDERARKALDPERFRGQEWEKLKEISLSGYNDIYKTNET